MLLPIDSFRFIQHPVMHNFSIRNITLTFFLLVNLVNLFKCQLEQANDVVSVDLKVRENSILHHTNRYVQNHYVTSESIVLRRGDPINIILHFRKPCKTTDKVRLELSFGSRPQLEKGTLIYIPILKEQDPINTSGVNWLARTTRLTGNQMTVQLFIPVNAAIGIWNLRASTRYYGTRTIRTYTVKTLIYILFNAYNNRDEVFLAHEDARNEYLQNEIGKIYVGSYTRPQGKKWIYGQFQESVLPAVMLALDRTRIDFSSRSSVVKVSRAVSALVNSNDDYGFIVGNWSGAYNDGLSPWKWTGSATILRKYLLSGGEPVKFGQCWVFAGVTTTALRTLGIPARTVSNFVSAHDTDDSLTVDKFFTEKGEPLTDINGDSVWNFHVWSDAWMARADLPPGYGGWQVLDATPQETSTGLYQLGPASIEAVKRGEIGFAYDVAFVFAEVNADVIHWVKDDRSELLWRKVKTIKFHVGRKILTKMIGYLDEYTAYGTADAENILHQYKNREGSEEERQSVSTAARTGGLKFFFDQPEDIRN